MLRDNASSGPFQRKCCSTEWSGNHYISTFETKFKYHINTEKCRKCKHRGCLILNGPICGALPEFDAHFSHPILLYTYCGQTKAKGSQSNVDAKHLPWGYGVPVTSHNGTQTPAVDARWVNRLQWGARGSFVICPKMGVFTPIGLEFWKFRLILLADYRSPAFGRANLHHRFSWHVSDFKQKIWFCILNEHHGLHAQCSLQFGSSFRMFQVFWICTNWMAHQSSWLLPKCSVLGVFEYQ